VVSSPARCFAPTGIGMAANRASMKVILINISLGINLIKNINFLPQFSTGPLGYASGLNSVIVIINIVFFCKFHTQLHTNFSVEDKTFICATF
jgi:O-antigen/teichoic acid export membrane protein